MTHFEEVHISRAKLGPECSFCMLLFWATFILASCLVISCGGMRCQKAQVHFFSIIHRSHVTHTHETEINSLVLHTSFLFFPGGPSSILKAALRSIAARARASFAAGAYKTVATPTRIHTCFLNVVKCLRE